MASSRDLTALPQCESSKTIGVTDANQVDTDVTSVPKKRQSLSDLFTIVSAPTLLPFHS